jgi:pilus assembly protein CpaD
MTFDLKNPAPAVSLSRHLTVRLAVCLIAALPLAACKHGEDRGKVAGWTLVDPSQRHPILVSQQPETLTLRVPRGANGLTPQQRADLVAFAQSSRAADAGNSRLVISAPSGSANESAAMQAVQEIGSMLSDHGFAQTDIAVEAFTADSEGSQPPVKVSYMRFVAEGPECGHWTENMAYNPTNLPYPNMGCANQKNFAAMIKNPADLITPRTMTARPAERRLVTWEKYLKGEVTGAEKSEEERIKTDDSN